MTNTRSILNYPGGKWRLAAWIARHLPPHRVYVEPHFGSGGVFFRKPRSPLETINDRDGDVYNLWKVCREYPEQLRHAIDCTPWSREEYDQAVAVPRLGDHPIEDARRFVVRVWMNTWASTGRWGKWRHETTVNPKSQTVGVRARHFARLGDFVGPLADRLAGVQIENRDALEMLTSFNDPGTLLYCDPPYVVASRQEQSKARYAHEMGDDEHLALLGQLRAHSGMVVLSAYPDPLYTAQLADWTRVQRTVATQFASQGAETLWLNPKAATFLNQMPLFGVAEDEREDDDDLDDPETEA